MRFHWRVENWYHLFASQCAHGWEMANKYTQICEWLTLVWYSKKEDEEIHRHPMRMIVQCSMLKNTNIRASDLSVYWWGMGISLIPLQYYLYYYEIKAILYGKTLRMLFGSSYPNQNRFKCHNFQANQTFSKLLIAFHAL